MSREIVACVASKPRCWRRRRTCSWLLQRLAIDEFEDDILSSGFHDSRCGAGVPARVRGYMISA